MGDIKELSKELNRALLESFEYKRYKACEKALKAQPELYNAANDFRRRNRHIMMYAANETIFNETDQLTKEFEGTLRNGLVNDFFVAEQKLVRLLQDTYACIGAGMEFDDSYMEGQ